MYNNKEIFMLNKAIVTVILLSLPLTLVRYPSYPEVVNQPVSKQVVSSTKEVQTKHKHTEIDHLVFRYAKKYNVEPSLVRAVIKVESSDKHSARSSVGAIGYMQLMPKTAKYMGVNPYTKEGNIEGGTKYLAYLHNRYNGDTTRVLAAYNAGEGVVKASKPIPKCTRHYVRKVMLEKSKLDASSIYS